METKYEKGDELEIEQINKTMKKKTLSRGMNVFSVVKFMLCRRRRINSFYTWFWRRGVESARKVHPEITIMPTSNFINTIVLPPAPPPVTDVAQDGGDDADADDEDRLSEADEVFTAASSPTSSGISRYGSAMSLRDLDYHYDDDDGGDDADNDDSGDRLSETDEVFTAASSPSSSRISRYGSAMSLRDLDYHYDDDEDVEGGDEMIDEKAEEFIVRFYEQIKKQNQVYIERCNDELIIFGLHHYHACMEMRV